MSNIKNSLEKLRNAIAKQNSVSGGACCYYDNYSGILSCFDGATIGDCQAKNGTLHPGYTCSQGPCIKKPKLEQSL